MLPGRPNQRTATKVCGAALAAVISAAMSGPHPVRAPQGLRGAPVPPVAAQDTEAMLMDVWKACRNPTVNSGTGSAEPAVGDSSLVRVRFLCLPLTQLAAKLGGTPGMALARLPNSADVRKFAKRPAGGGPILDSLSAGAGLYFMRGDATLSPEVEQRARKVADLARDYLIANPGHTLTLYAMTDSTGTAESNRRLADARAAYLATLLAQEGADLGRVTTVLCPARVGSRVGFGPGGRSCDLVDRHQRIPAHDAAFDRTVVLTHSWRRQQEGENAYVGSRISGASAVRSAIASSGLPLLASPIADAVIAAAPEDLESSLWAAAGRRLCDGPAKPYLDSTCKEVTRSDTTGFLEVDALRGALRADLRGAYQRGIQAALQRLAQKSCDSTCLTVQDRLVAVAIVLDALRQRQWPNDPWALVENAPRAATTLFGRTPPPGLASTWLALSGIAANYAVARRVFPRVGIAGDVDKDEVFGTAIRAYLVARVAGTHGRDTTASGPPVPLPRLRALCTAAIELRGIAERDSQIATVRTEPLRASTLIETLLVVASALDTDAAHVAIMDSVLVGAVDVSDALAAGQYLGAYVRALNTGRQAGLDTLLLDRSSPLVQRTLDFTVTLADARDGQTASQVLHEFMASGTGYRGKRLRPLAVAGDTAARGAPCPPAGWVGRLTGACRRYVTLNAYLGGAAAIEAVRTATGNGVAGRGQLAYYLPVGIEVGMRPSPLPQTVERGKTRPAMGSSWGILLQLADLGAVAGARISGSRSDNAPSSASQFIAPGVLFTHSWRTSYWSWLVGAEFAPDARRLRSGAMRSAWRFTVVPLAFDVPIFP